MNVLVRDHEPIKDVEVDWIDATKNWLYNRNSWVQEERGTNELTEINYAWVNLRAQKGIKTKPCQIVMPNSKETDFGLACQKH